MADDDLILPNRRQSDAQIESLRQEIEVRVESGIAAHFTNDHYNISREKVTQLIESSEQREREHMESKELLSHISIAVQGVPEKDFQGNLVGYSGGIQSDIAELKDRANGGGGFSTRGRDKLVTAALTTFMVVGGQVIIAIIGG